MNDSAFIGRRHDVSVSDWDDDRSDAPDTELVDLISPPARTVTVVLDEDDALMVGATLQLLGRQSAHQREVSEQLSRVGKQLRSAANVARADARGGR